MLCFLKRLEFAVVKVLVAHGKLFAVGFALMLMMLFGVTVIHTFIMARQCLHHTERQFLVDTAHAGWWQTVEFFLAGPKLIPQEFRCHQQQEPVHGRAARGFLNFPVTSQVVECFYLLSSCSEQGLTETMRLKTALQMLKCMELCPTEVERLPDKAVLRTISQCIPSLGVDCAHAANYYLCTLAWLKATYSQQCSLLEAELLCVVFTMFFTWLIIEVVERDSVSLPLGRFAVALQVSLRNLWRKIQMRRHHDTVTAILQTTNLPNSIVRRILFFRGDSTRFD